MKPKFETMRNKWKKWMTMTVAGSLVLLIAGQLSGQSLEEAVRLSQTGRFGQAQEMFTRLRIQAPGNPQVLLSQAHNLAWMGRYGNAVQVFEFAAANGADPVEVALGAGFAQAWAGRYPAARQQFSAVLEKNPEQLEALKGMGYTYLWDERPAEAIPYFEKALAAAPAGSDELEKALAEARRPRAFLETDLWMGYTRLAEGQSQTGLRALQLTGQVAHRTRAFLKYDNSLGLDILTFAREDQTIPFVSGGLARQWSRRLLSELEYGLRFFDSGASQQIISGSQVVFLPGNLRLKAGALAGFGQEAPTEWMTYASVNVGIAPGLNIEPTYYFVTPPGSSIREHRLQLGLQYHHPKGYHLNLAGLYGRTAITGDGGTLEPVAGWSVATLAPLTGAVGVQGILRYEKAAFYEFTTVALGVKLRFDRVPQ